ncbi:Major facilitator superfamily MFS_1 [Nostoc sp. NIES-3756]|uniref:MFS transporter n=1 Tax=Nostoc sp. NIES-3756 TaxID=1751286 RepID=UPI00071FEFCA|nr:MFS transporter [Nostoc sp. NIES-3756]BAT51374.1 Major facilitator superfamily MFS_1 [Nostoc sp. NIES-3756]BAY40912.1 major facilitator superfamily MFS_1 [Nostoc sp. NIES-2111]
MKLTLPSQLVTWLSPIHPQIWVLAIARFLSEVGSGFTAFYAPIFFVNQVGLSATSVGVGLASAATSGFLGRILGGTLTDTAGWGRRRTLLLAMAISAMGSLVLATTSNFATLVIGSLIYGLGIGVYWPATEAIIADNSQVENRREAFALTRLADHLGLAIGLVLAGVLVTIAENYRWLFVIDAISFTVFFAVAYLAITEPDSNQTQPEQKPQQLTAWFGALSDRRFLIYIAVNIFFTIYISQIHSILPLYFKNSFQVGETMQGFHESTISTLFACHLVIAILLQMPVTSILKRFSHTLALTISAVLWAVGFSLVWIASTTSSYQLIWATLALSIFAIANVSYTPSAASLVTDLAPESQRGVYFSINSLCWAAGSFIGSPLGGWALDQPQTIAQNLWLGFVFSVAIAITILQFLSRILGSRE